MWCIYARRSPIGETINYAVSLVERNWQVPQNNLLEARMEFCFGINIVIVLDLNIKTIS